MTKPTTRKRGNMGEDLAAAYLESMGMTVVDRNYFFERSEVDIVAFDDTTVVFVEVKLRANAHFGTPEEFVTESKIAHIYKAAEAWIYERKMDGYPVRFDVVSIIQSHPKKAPDIKHLKDAFR